MVMGVPSTGCSGRFWANSPLLFVSNCKLQGGFVLGLQCCSLAIPTGTQETEGDPWEDWMRIEERWLAEREERKHPFSFLKSLSHFNVGKKKKRECGK